MIQNNKTRTMKHQFILFQRAGIFYCEDTGTGKQTSLRTRDRDQAQRLLNAKNEALRQPAMNLQIAQVYLHHSDPALASRTWQKVMEHIITTKHGSTQARWRSAIKDKAFDLIRHRRLLESTGEQFLTVLHAGTVATNLYLRRIHHYAVTMHWLPWPVLSKLHWPPLVYQAKRAITLDEHWQLLAVERSPVRRAFYEILWHFGGSQTDMARLTAEDIDWQRQTIAYRRHKSGTMAVQAIGAEVAAVLRTLPQAGYLFPTLADISPSYRGHAFVSPHQTVEVETPIFFADFTPQCDEQAIIGDTTDFGRFLQPAPCHAVTNVCSRDVALKCRRCKKVPLHPCQ